MTCIKARALAVTQTAVMESPNATVTADAARPLGSLLAAAPHRLLFFGGATALLLSMGWWTAWLASARFGPWLAPPPALPPGWAHAVGMQYQVLPLFVFGFLLTVFPRWMDLPAYRARDFLPVGGGLLGGYLLLHLGLLGWAWLVHAGLLLTLLAWSRGLYLLLRLLVADRARCDHALAAVVALAFGLSGLLLLLAFLHGGDARLAYATLRIGSFGLLLPIFLTVCHRMLPFFSQAALARLAATAAAPEYRPWRPRWLLWSCLGLCWSHLLLELMHGHQWLWLVDLPLTVGTGYMAWRWWDRRIWQNGLLLVLHLGFLWLPLALAAYTLQSLWYWLSGDFVLGRVPVHLLAVGYFGSLVVAMVTRVSHGHSGRPLELGLVPRAAFVAIQAVVVLRVLAEFQADSAWMLLAAAGWLLALLPWVLRSVWIYLTPRLDSKPG